MLLIAFFALFASCLALWIAGASAALVFSVAFAAWAAFAVVVYPKIRGYKVTMGIDDRLNAVEGRGWAWVGLHVAGLKVMILGFLTSMVPFIGSFATWLSGQNLGVFFGPDSSQKITFYVGAIVFALPFLSSWLHIGALKDAAETQLKA